MGVGALVGRAAELAVLRDALRECDEGHGRLVALVGEPGVGKTRLCEELVAERGARVGWAGCTAGAADAAYLVWEVLLAQIEPPAWLSPQLGRPALVAEVVAALRRATTAGSWLLVVDDVQWADPSSAALLRAVSPLLRALPVLVVVTVRAGASDDALRHALRVEVAPLDEAESHSLAAALGSPRADLADVVAAAGGNPLLLQQLVGGSGPGAESFVRRQWEHLDDAQRDALTAVVVTGDPSTSAHLGRVLDRPALVVEQLLRAAPAVVVERGGRWQARHPLLRDAVLAVAGTRRRRERHDAELGLLRARAAAGHPVEAALLARHAHGAGRVAEAVELLTEAAEVGLVRFAHEHAAVLADTALDLVTDTRVPGDVLALRLLAARARRAAGDSPETRAELLDLARAAEAAGRADVQAGAALALADDGLEVALFDDDQVDALRRAYRALPSGPLRADVAARLSIALTYRASEEERRVLVADAVAQVGADPLVGARVLAARCDVHAGPADAERRLGDAREIVRSAGHDPTSAQLGRRLAVVAALECGRLDEVDEHLRAYERATSTTRRPSAAWYAALWRSTRALMRGDWATHEEELAVAERLGEVARSPNARILTTGQRWFGLLQRGEEAAAREHFDRLVPPGTYAELGTQIIASLALHHAVSGAGGRARALLDDAVAGLPGLPVDSEWLPTVVQCATAACRLGGHPAADLLERLLLPYADRWAVEGIGAYCHGPVHRQLALLARLRGDERAAGERTRRAVAALRATDAPGLLEVVEREASSAGALDSAPALAPPLQSHDAVAHRTGDTWQLVFRDRTAHVRDSKGVRDLARLLAVPDRDVPALDLVTSPGPTGIAEVELHVPGDLGEVVDARARHAYRARLVDLEDELADADAAGDGARSERLAEERDALLGQLVDAYGLGGRARRAGDPAERARSTVTARIRQALKRISDAHPDLGRHLTASVRTGTLCRYAPPDPVVWHVTP